MRARVDEQKCREIEGKIFEGDKSIEHKLESAYVRSKKKDIEVINLFKGRQKSVRMHKRKLSKKIKNV